MRFRVKKEMMKYQGIDQRILNTFDNPGYGLEDVYLLDRIAKNVMISKAESARLRELGLIGGRYPKIYILAEPGYLRHSNDQNGKQKKGDSEDDLLKAKIVSYLKDHGSGSKKELLAYLADDFQQNMTEKQQDYKIRNLLKALKADGIVDTDSENNRKAIWVLIG